MKRTLDKAEIDALAGKAKAVRKGDAIRGSKKILPCDMRRSKQLAADQISVVTTLHQSFARRLSGSMGAHLRVAFDTQVVSAEQLTYKEFLDRLPELTYVASVHAMPINARAALQIDMAVAYASIDIILGGSGSDKIETRDLTEIEEQILETVVQLILLDLHTAWAPVLDLDFQFEQRQRSLQLQSSMISNEKVLCINFEVHVAESIGTLTMVFPAVVSNSLLRRLSAQWSYSERLPSRDSRRRIRENLLDCRFKADLSLPNTPLPIRKLINLEPGQVLTFPKCARDPIHLNIAGKPAFLARPVRNGTQRAARVEARLFALTNAAGHQG